MTCIAWDGVKLVCDSKVTVRDMSEHRLSAIKTRVLEKPIKTKAGDTLWSITGSGRLDLIEAYLDKVLLAAEADMKVEELIEMINKFSINRGGETTQIILTGVHSDGDKPVCYQLGKSLTRITKSWVWGSASNAAKELLAPFKDADALVATHGLSSLNHDRCGLPYHVFNPMTQEMVTHNTVPVEVAVKARELLEGAFKTILDRTYTKPVTRRGKAK